TVTYDDPVVPLRTPGQGHWTIQGHKLRIDWDVGSWDEWNLPLVPVGRGGVWHSCEGRLGTVKAAKKGRWRHLRVDVFRFFLSRSVGLSSYCIERGLMPEME